MVGRIGWRGAPDDGSLVAGFSSVLGRAFFLIYFFAEILVFGWVWGFQREGGPFLQVCSSSIFLAVVFLSAGCIVLWV